MRYSAPPYYFTYGDPVRDVDPAFVHVERVMDRGAFHHGHVKDHSHPHLHQLSFWLQSHGSYYVDDNRHILNGPVLTWMPSGIVHGFEVSETSDSIVVSLSDDFVADCLASMDVSQIRAVLREPLVLDLSEEVSSRLERIFLEMEREYRFPSWGQSQALDACVRLVFISMARIAEVQRATEDVRSAHRHLFARFLELLEGSFREHRTVAEYCTMLGSTPYLLNLATQAGAGMRASHVIRTRLVQEAKRQLLYSVRDIGEIAFSLGFADPAHFGRLFKTVAGASPTQWRAQNRQ